MGSALLRQESDAPFLIRLITPFGPMAVACRDGLIERLWLPERSNRSLDQKLARSEVEGWKVRRGTALEQDLARYFRGDVTPLPYAVNERGLTPFARKVFGALRRIEWGTTISYGTLARSIGRPGASRAVGAVMAHNKTPLVAPCHRVVGIRSVGGFSGPGGAPLKEKLLIHEGCDLSRLIHDDGSGRRKRITSL